MLWRFGFGCLRQILPTGYHPLRLFGGFHLASRPKLNRVRALLKQSPLLTQPEREAWQPGDEIFAAVEPAEKKWERFATATGKPIDEVNGDPWLTSSAGRSPRNHFPQGKSLGFPSSGGPGQFDRGYVQPRNAKNAGEPL